MWFIVQLCVELFLSIFFGQGFYPSVAVCLWAHDNITEVPLNAEDVHWSIKSFVFVFSFFFFGCCWQSFISSKFLVFVLKLEIDVNFKKVKGAAMGVMNWIWITRVSWGVIDAVLVRIF